ncbi:MAG: hypothetical protein NC180_12695, partial [Muribaculaceae bacterium]|nr:hypothetical protein [Muribaculaceae bacterium]
MQKRRGSLLQKLMVVLLSAVLAAGMADGGVLQAIYALEDTEMQEYALVSKAAADSMESSTTWNGTVSSTEITGGTESAPAVIKVDGTVKVDGTLTISSGYVKFTGGGTLQWSSAATNAVVIKEGANVTFENVTLDGNNKLFINSALLIEGTAAFCAGTTVKAFRSSGYSGAGAGNKGVIAVYGKGLLNIYDGVTITGNKSTSGIIALYQRDEQLTSPPPSTATVNMYGGAIAGNTVDSDLGVIWNWCGNLNISGGTVTAEGSEYAVHTQGNNGYNAATTISGGRFTGGKTGAVCAGKDSSNKSAITITGGIFSGNKAATVNYGTIDIRGGIYNGTGYALSCAGSGTLTVNAGEFTGGVKAYYGKINTQTDRVVVGKDKQSAVNWDKTSSLNNYQYVMIGEIDEEGKRHTHSYESGWKSDEEKHWQECACGEKSGESAHSYGEWMTTKEATESEPGIKERSCSVCGYKDEEAIPKITHTHNYGDGWESDEEKHWQECACGEKSGESAHSYGEWTTTKEATESEPGVKERSCSVCGYKDEEVIPKIAHTHSYGDGWKSDKEKHWQECTCGEKSGESAHSYGEWTTTKEATESETGIKERSCSVCGYKDEEVIP